MSSIPWRRVRRGLAQYARQNQMDRSRVGEICAILHHLVGVCGSESRSRQALYHIGCALLAQWPAHLYVPVCPDYSHAGHKYNFQTMGSGVPLLFHRHKPFVERVLMLLPDARVTVLLADHERELQHLRGALQIDAREFEDNLKGTLAALTRTVPNGWEVSTFTHVFPDFVEHVQAKMSELLADPKQRPSLEHDMTMRSGLYDKIGYPADVRLQCTAHVSAQYFCLGQEAARRHALVVNHTTTSLRQYNRSLAGLLHNSVTVY